MINFMINRVFNKVLKIKNEKFEFVQEMKKGTDSKVFLVNKKYIFKFHNKNVIRAEYEFFNLNKNQLNEKIVYVDKRFRYIVYEFIENGDKNFEVNELILIAQNYIDNYVSYDGNGYGFLFEEKVSWKEYLESELADKKENALKVLDEEDYQKVVHEIDVIDKFKFDKKLMHGDLGLHNMLFLNNEIVGVIDPQPIIGDSLYEFIFFVFSNKKIAENLSVKKIYEYVINEPKEKVDSLILFVLFCRIARCEKYHLQDLDFFVSKWKEIAKQI